MGIIDDHCNGEHPDQPMFLMFAPPNAHAPIQYHYEYDTECSYIKETSELIRYKYCNLMQELDASIGNLVNKLKENGMWERSIIVFTSDNGGLMCWDVGSPDSCSGAVNLPLRGGKGTLFEGSIRVRSILSGGFMDESLKGTTSESYMHATDLFSTLLTAANVDSDVIYGPRVDGKQSVKGLPFWGYLNGLEPNPPTRETPFIADLKLDETSSYIESAALFWKGYKYIIQPMELYDGWWTSPLQGTPMEIPTGSEGIQTEPRPLPAKPDPLVLKAADNIDGTAQADSGVLKLGGDDGVIDIDWSTLKVNEYLFKIQDDPAETKNIRMDPDALEVLEEIHGFLEELTTSALFWSVAQDSGTSLKADPSNFNNVWYPFEEKYG